MLQQGVSTAQGLANSVQQQQVAGAYQVPTGSSSNAAGQYVSQNPNPSGAFDPSTGDTLLVKNPSNPTVTLEKFSCSGLYC
jgi:hypothetical protein